MEIVLLEDIKIRGELTNESEKFCIQHRLFDLSSIKNFITSESSAIILEKTANDIKNNLRDICKTYHGSEEVRIKDVSIRELAFIEQMSQRSLNICIIAEIFSLRDLLSYRLSHPNFKNIRNSGEKTNLELSNICKKYNDLLLQGKLDFELVSSETNTFTNDISSLELSENIDLETLVRIEHISVRSYNVCKKAELTSLKLLLVYYINSPNKQFLSLQNCGIGSNYELVTICEKYRNLVNDVKSIKDECSVVEFSPIDLFISNFKLDNETYRRLRSIISSNRDFPVFTAINLLIESNYIFKKELYTFVFKQLFHCYLPIKEYTLEEIGKMTNLTRERVRQIRENDIRILNSFFTLFKGLINKLSCVKYIDLSEPIIFLSEEKVSSINSHENTSFSPLFITYILSILYSENYIWFGERSDFIKKNNSKRKNKIKNHYLIHRDVLQNFNLGNFIEHLINLHKQRRYEDTYYVFADLFKGYCTENVIDTKLLTVVKHITAIEFGGEILSTSKGLIFLSNQEGSLKR